ncbi:hypothetical protein [Cupriavidus oxalaticus]|uniref:hypothetical protein n=1 Tax=Cupriavidus oxalaticus TaxID=96344 RepID=UPI003D64F42D
MNNAWNEVAEERDVHSFGPIRQHFALKRYLLRALLYRKHLAARFAAWHEFTEVAQCYRQVDNADGLADIRGK